MSETKNYDVIVIGAGCGGLSAAASIAREGKKVLVLERQNKPGGFLGSFVRGRFEFDVSLNSLCGSLNENFSETQFLLDEIGVFSKIDWNHLPNSYRLITKDKNDKKIDITLPFGVDNFIKEIEKNVPGSEISLKKLFKIAEEVHSAITALSSLPQNPTRSALNGIIKDYPNFARTASYSVDDVLRALSIPDKARYILEAYWVKFGVDCTRLNFAHFIDNLYCYLTCGGIVPKNRSYAIAMAIVSEIEDNGGTVFYNSTVSRIKYKNGKPCAVVLKSGEIYNSEHIICTCSPNLAYGKLLKEKDVPETAVKRTNARTFGVRSAKIYIGLNRSPKDLGIKDYQTFITSTGNTLKQFEQMKKIETNTNMTAVCFNIANPDCSPAGTTILCLETFYTDNCWADVLPEEYFNEKDLLAARLITQYEKSTGITIFNAIEEIEVATPVTFARYTGTPQGVTYGYAGMEWDGMLARFMTEKNDCDIPGLRFCGAWGVQLHGVSSTLADGRNTAFALINDIDGEVEQ